MNQCSTFLSVIVVLYNDVIDNIACLSEAKCSPYVKDIVICDNSTVPNKNAERAAALGLEYIAMEGNQGLPCAYKRGVEKSSGSVVCLFDDDSLVESRYFEAIANSFENDLDLDIALPLVISNNMVLSPCHFNGFRSKKFENIASIHICDDISGINSGMAIRKSVFDRVQHCQSLFLDFVDHRFILDAKKAELKISYIPIAILHQNYSLNSDSKNQAISRLRIFERDARVFFSDSFGKSLYGTLVCVYRRLKLCLHYHSFKFLYTK